jgi:hypothetical protein
MQGYSTIQLHRAEYTKLSGRLVGLGRQSQSVVDVAALRMLHWRIFPS